MQTATPVTNADQWERDLVELLGLDASPAAQVKSRAAASRLCLAAKPLLLAAAAATILVPFLLVRPDRSAPTIVHATARDHGQGLRSAALRNPVIVPVRPLAPPPGPERLIESASDDAMQNDAAQPRERTLRERASARVHASPRSRAAQVAIVRVARTAAERQAPERVGGIEANAAHQLTAAASEKQAPSPTAIAARAAVGNVPPSVTARETTQSPSKSDHTDGKPAVLARSSPAASSTASGQKVVLAYSDVRDSAPQPRGSAKTSSATPATIDILAKKRKRTAEAIDAIRLLRRQ